MSLVYTLRKERDLFFLSVSEKGSKRKLYLDTLKSLAQKKDQEALELLVKIHFSSYRNKDTATFEKVQIPPKYLKQLIFFLEKTDHFQNELEIKKKKELFLTPELHLKDSSGCFANLWMNYGEDSVAFHDFAPTVLAQNRKTKEEKAFEKDLLDAGYEKKVFETSQYYCSKEKVKETLELLLELGWQIFGPQEKKIEKEIFVEEEAGKIYITSSSKALVDYKLQMEGVWEGERFVLKKEKIGALFSLLEKDKANWDLMLKKKVEALLNGEGISEVALPPSFQAELLSHQKKGVNWLAFLSSWGFSALLADEMGLGKTVQVLAFLAQRRQNLPVLIVVPASLLFHWKGEIERFFPELNYSLVSYSKLVKDIEVWKNQVFDVIVLDESNAIKQAKTERARAVFRLQGRFRICLSGTPFENRLDEIWSQFHFLLPNLLDRGIDVEQVKKRIQPFILRRKKDELTLPPKLEQLVWVEMGEEQKALYDTYLQGAKGKNPLEVILRLRQIALDPRILGYEIPGAKTELFLEELEEIREEGRKVLVFSQFSSLLALLKKEIPEALLLDGSTSLAQREAQVHLFQKSLGFQVFLVSLKAGGVGLNLTNADYVYLLDPWWNEASENQAIDRAHRIGRKETVIARRMVAVNTVEEKILQLKKQKLETAEHLLDLEEMTALSPSQFSHVFDYLLQASQ